MRDPSRSIVVSLLVRYSSRPDQLRLLLNVLRRIEQGDQADEPSVRPAEPRPRGLTSLTDEDVRQLMASSRAGTTRRKLVERYGISESSVNRLLRKYR